MFRAGVTTKALPLVALQMGQAPRSTSPRGVRCLMSSMSSTWVMVTLALMVAKSAKDTSCDWNSFPILLRFRNVYVWEACSAPWRGQQFRQDGRDDKLVGKL